ncbi:hypothetical protein ABT297_22640 [Dactylosporangium sp. NPDC000555]|uniref:hypothetical protein n=1 Tax=Dactylosporangium sp. NPDC000555 TaxID=3154260 RepID=UPI003324BEE3
MTGKLDAVSGAAAAAQRERGWEEVLLLVLRDAGAWVEESDVPAKLSARARVFAPLVSRRDVRPLDLLLFFLYRVLERPGQDNGKAFVVANVDRIEEYPLGDLYTTPLTVAPQQPVHVFEEYRQRAVGRIEALRSADVDIVSNTRQDHKAV